MGDPMIEALIAKWRKPALAVIESNDEAVHWSGYDTGREACADELLAALRTQPDEIAILRENQRCADERQAELTRELLEAEAEVARLTVVGTPAPSGWEPIATAPKDEVLWFWVRPKTPEEAYTDADGNSIFRAGPPRLFTGKYRTWSALETADYWMRIPLPAPPRTEARG